MSKTMTRDLTKGNVTKLILQFAFPLFVSNALQAIYNIVDMIVVGQAIGGSGMSAVSIGGDVLHLLTFVAMGFSSAGQVLIAQDIGAGRREEVKRIIGNMFTFLLASSIVISLVCFAFRNGILVLLNTPKESFAYTMDYTVTCICGLPFIYGYNAVSAILRGMGDSKRPFVFIAIAALLNIILDYVFVMFCGMEVFGAAFATVIGQGVSFVISIIYLYRRKEEFGFDFKLKSFALRADSLSRLVALGIPMAIQSAAVSMSKIVLMAWINSFGVIYSALAGIYNKVGMMCGIVSNSFTAAGSSVVGQNLGARKFDRIRKALIVVLVLGLIFSGAFTLVLVCMGDEAFKFFTTDAEVLAVASILILPSVLNFFGAATRSMAFSLINGSGNTYLNLAVALIDGIISRVGIAALLGFALKMNCLGFWYGDAIAGFMPFIIGLVYLISGKWKAVPSEKS